MPLTGGMGKPQVARAPEAFWPPLNVTDASDLERTSHV